MVGSEDRGFVVPGYAGVCELPHVSDVPEAAASAPVVICVGLGEVVAEPAEKKVLEVRARKTGGAGVRDQEPGNYTCSPVVEREMRDEWRHASQRSGPG